MYKSVENTTQHNKLRISSSTPNIYTESCEYGNRIRKQTQ